MAATGVLVRVKQVLVVLAGIGAAALMVGLGLWQLHVYERQGERAAQARASAAAVPVTSVAPVGQPVGDGFGRHVQVTGSYRADLQLLAPLGHSPGRYRVLTPLVTAEGAVVPVVRGLVDTTAAPAPPGGVQQVTGVLLPSEEQGDPGAAGPGIVSSVRLPALAQRWPNRLIGGYVTLDAGEAGAQGLAAAPAALPNGHGGLQNAAYAVQWWLFAAFAIAMGIRMAIDIGRRDDLALLAADVGADPPDRGPPAADVTSASTDDPVSGWARG